MEQNEKKDKVYSLQTNSFFEVRFIPDPSILDKRGTISQKLMSDIKYWDHWKIDPNIINLSGKLGDSDVTGFFSYKNFGMQYVNSISDSSFTSAAQTFLKSAWDIVEPSTFLRVGLRYMVLVPVKSNLKQFTKEFIDKTLSKSMKNLVTKDISVSMDSVVNDINVHIQIGPMGEEQAKQYMNVTNVPETSLYIDIDVSIQDFQSYKKQSQLKEFIETSINIKNEKIDSIKDLLGIKDGENTK